MHASVLGPWCPHVLQDVVRIGADSDMGGGARGRILLAMGVKQIEGAICLDDDGPRVDVADVEDELGHPVVTAVQDLGQGLNNCRVCDLGRE